MREQDADKVYDEKTARELRAAVDLIRKANQAGLLAEVVLDLTRAVSGTTEEKLTNIAEDWYL